MMKSVLASLVFAGTLALTGCAADLEAAKTPLGSIVSVVDVPGVKQDVLYSNSKIWIAKTFTDANSVIQYADKEQGSIVGKGNVAYPCTDAMDCMANADLKYKFTMKIDTKDNKARITFDDVTMYRPASVRSGVIIPTLDTSTMSIRGQERAKQALNGIVEQYKNEIRTQSTSASQDW